MLGCDVEIIDATMGSSYKQFLYRCLAPMPFHKYKRRTKYLEDAIPKGLHKKILIFKGDVVGQIEYAPPAASGYPISGKDIIVMNCIWVLRKVKGHRLGTCLMKAMMENEKEAISFATIGLEGHWSGWLRKEHMEMLGFRSIDSVRVTHKTKHVGEPFTIHLMWLPRKKDTEPPIWARSRMLEGVYFCQAHPLYHSNKIVTREILKEL